MSRHGVRIATLVQWALGVLVIGWLGLRVLLSQGGSLPQVTWMGIVVMLLLAAVLVAAGWDIRRYLQGKHRRRPSTGRARYTLVGAQAGAVTGSMLLGWYLSACLTGLGLPGTPGLEALTWRYGWHAACALVLAVAGLFGQWCCRLPEDDEDSAARRSGVGPETAAS